MKEIANILNNTTLEQGGGWGGREQHKSGHKALEEKWVEYYLYFISLSLSVRTCKMEFMWPMLPFSAEIYWRLKEYNIYKRSLKNSEHSVSRRYYLMLLVVLSMPGRLHDVYASHCSLFFNITFYYRKKKFMRLYIDSKFKKIMNRPQLLYFPQTPPLIEANESETI